MKNLYLIFNDVEAVHLGKDVFLTPYYISKTFNLELKIVFPDTETNINLNETYRNSKFIREKFIGKNNRWFIKELNFFKYLFLNAKKIDNLMLFHLGAKTSLMTLLYKGLNSNGKVYVKADMDKKGLELFQNYQIDTLKRKINYNLIKKFFEKVDLISVETKEIYEKILQNGLYGIDISQKLDYIPNGFDEEILSQLDVKIKPFEEKENIMITVGRLGTYQKNNELLLSALDGENLENWKVMLIGPFDEGFEKTYKDFIEKNPDKRENVILVGNIDDKKELFEYYNKSKVFLLTSRWEGFALVFPEALKFGNYIISTDVGGARDITDNSRIGKVIPVEDSEALKREIKKVIRREINLQNKYTNSLEWSDKNFIWENIIKNSEKMNNLFNNKFFFRYIVGRIIC